MSDKQTFVVFIASLLFALLGGLLLLGAIQLTVARQVETQLKRSVISISLDFFTSRSVKIPKAILPGAITVMLTGYATVICLNLLTNCHKMSSSIAETEAKVYGHNLSV